MKVSRFYLMFLVGWVSLCVVALISSDTFAQAKKVRKVVVPTDATWPPMEMVDAHKKIVGFDIDFMNAVAKEAGFQVEYRNTAWDGIFGGLEAKKYDAIISSVTITEERQKKYDFSEPYVNVGQILVIPKAAKNVGVGRPLEPALAAIRAIPGVEAATAISSLPYQSWGNNSNTRYEGQPGNDPTRLPIVEQRRGDARVLRRHAAAPARRPPAPGERRRIRERAPSSS